MPPDDEWDWAEKEAHSGGNGDSNTNFRPGGVGANRKARRRRSRTFKQLLSSAEFLARMKPPDYLVEGLLRRGCTYTLTGNTGHGKTLIALLLAIKVARGDWFCGKKCKPGKVAFFAGENPENVMMQFYALCCAMEIDPKTLDIVWHDGVFDLDRAQEPTRLALAKHPDLALCIYDSLQAFFSGEDDSQNMPMLDTALNFRGLSEDHPNRPTGIILAHPIKKASQDNLLPRGGSAITNELDGNLTAWLDEDKNVITLHWRGKFRGVPFDPIKLELFVVKPQGLVDADGDQMPCTVIRQMLESREAELAKQTESRQIKILTAIKASPKVTLNEIGMVINQSKSTANRLVNGLIAVKWIRRSGNRLYVTKDGLAVLKEVENET